MGVILSASCRPGKLFLEAKPKKYLCKMGLDHKKNVNPQAGLSLNLKAGLRINCTSEDHKTSGTEK